MEDLPCLCIGRINIMKMATLLRATYIFNTMLIKIPISFFAEIEKSILKFIWKNKRMTGFGDSKIVTRGRKQKV
jgi:hypothetical protein